MSRFRKKGINYSIAFGVDHAIGIFVTVWDHTEYDEPHPDNIYVDEDKLTKVVTFERIKELAIEYNIPITDSEIKDVLKGGI